MRRSRQELGFREESALYCKILVPLGPWCTNTRAGARCPRHQMAISPTTSRAFRAITHGRGGGGHWTEAIRTRLPRWCCSVFQTHSRPPGTIATANAARCRTRGLVCHCRGACGGPDEAFALLVQIRSRTRDRGAMRLCTIRPGRSLMFRHTRIGCELGLDITRTAACCAGCAILHS